MLRVRLTARVRAEVTAQAHGCCEYCRAQERFSPDSFSVEHITPLFEKGASEPGNLAYSCQGCNNRNTYALKPLIH